MPQRPEPLVGQRRPMPGTSHVYDFAAREWRAIPVMIQPAPRPRRRPRTHGAPVVPMDLSTGNPVAVPHAGWVEDWFRPDDQKSPPPRTQYMKTGRIPQPFPSKYAPR